MLFTIGEKFPLKVKILYTGDYYYFNIISNTIILAYIYENPSFQEINCMKGGKCEFAITEKQGIPFFLSKVGKMPWSDAALNHHLISEEFTTVPVEGYGYPILFMMVDRNTNIIKTMRTIGVSNQFSKELKNILELNKAFNLNDAEYRARTADVHSRHSTSDLLKQAVTYSKEFVSRNPSKNLNKSELQRR